MYPLGNWGLVHSLLINKYDVNSTVTIITILNNLSILFVLLFHVVCPCLPFLERVVIATCLYSPHRTVRVTSVFIQHYLTCFPEHHHQRREVAGCSRWAGPNGWMWPKGDLRGGPWAWAAHAQLSLCPWKTAWHPGHDCGLLHTCAWGNRKYSLVWWHRVHMGSFKVCEWRWGFFLFCFFRSLKVI